MAITFVCTMSKLRVRRLWIHGFHPKRVSRILFSPIFPVRPQGPHSSLFSETGGIFLAGKVAAEWI